MAKSSLLVDFYDHLSYINYSVGKDLTLIMWENIEIPYLIFRFMITHSETLPGTF